MGKSAEALDALSKAVQADPSNVTARVNLASKYANSNKLTQAINEYNSLVKMGHTQPEVLLNLAKCLITAKRIDEAKKYLRETLAADPRNVEARWELAHIFWKNEKNLAKAKEELRLAINANAEVASLYEGMAGILEEEGNKKEAVENLNRAKIYSSEVLVKERIQAWIDKLEGRTASMPAGSEAQTQMGGMQTLKREDEQPRKTAATKTAPAKPVKVDMGNLLDEDDNASKDPFGDIGKKK
jgi:tetratricopeptide (TPR) repeat protein